MKKKDCVSITDLFFHFFFTFKEKCEHTEPIRNGRFIYGRWTSPFIEGDTIFFSCDEGYNPLDESATATCTKDGWSPPPSCVTSAGKLD